MYQKECCPKCYTELEHIKIKKEDVFGCPKCKKEITRDEADKINVFTVICVCNTEIEIEENSVAECFNCGRSIDDRGVIQ
jgi:ribosomal protein L37AE/L43A